MHASLPLGVQDEINSVYLTTCGPLADSTLVWGSDLELEPLEEFLAARRINERVLTSPIHVLIAAVTRALAEHPEFNTRVRGTRLESLPGVQVLVPARVHREGPVMMISLDGVEQMDLDEISRSMWSELQVLRTRSSREMRRMTSDQRSTWGQRTYRHLYARLAPFAIRIANRFRWRGFGWLDPLQTPSVLVNHLEYANGPPMTFFKPSSLPMNAAPLYVALGSGSPRVVARDNSAVIRKVAPLIVRADHRLIDTPHLARFVATLRGYLMDPTRLVESERTAKQDIGAD